MRRRRVQAVVKVDAMERVAAPRTLRGNAPGRVLDHARATARWKQQAEPFAALIRVAEGAVSAILRCPNVEPSLRPQRAKPMAIVFRVALRKVHLALPAKPGMFLLA